MVKGFRLPQAEQEWLDEMDVDEVEFIKRLLANLRVSQGSAVLRTLVHRASR